MLHTYLSLKYIIILYENNICTNNSNNARHNIIKPLKKNMLLKGFQEKEGTNTGKSFLKFHLTWNLGWIEVWLCHIVDIQEMILNKRLVVDRALKAELTVCAKVYLNDFMCCYKGNSLEKHHILERNFVDKP